MRLHLHHPLVVGAVAAALSLVGVALYAGENVSLALITLFQSIIYLALWLASAAGWGAPIVRWATRGMKPDPLLTATTTLAAGLGVIGLGVLLGGLTGFVNAAFGWTLLAIGWALGVALYAVHRGAAKPVKPLATAAEPKPDARWNWVWLCIVPTLAIVLVASLAPAGWLWKPEEPHGYDVVEYHLQIPREWLEAGQIIPLRHNAFSFFPFGVEMHYLLAMQIQGGAWKGMHLAQLMHAAMTALSVAAAYGVAKQLGCGRAATTIATLALATTPWLAQLAPIGFNEGGLLLFGTLALGWMLIAVGQLNDASAGAPSRLFRRFALAGAMAGFACGVKLTAGPLVLAAAPIMTLAVARRSAFRRSLAGAAVFSVVGLIVFSPWLVKNIAWCGNPVFPEATSLFGSAHFTEPQVQRWKAAHAPRPDQQSFTGRVSAFASEVLAGWQFGYVALPLAALAIGFTWRRRQTWFLTGLLLLHGVFWIGFTHLQGRFFVLALPIAALLIAETSFQAWPRRQSWFNVGLAAVIAPAAIAGWWTVHEKLYFKLHEERGTGRGRWRWAATTCHG